MHTIEDEVIRFVVSARGAPSAIVEFSAKRSQVEHSCSEA